MIDREELELHKSIVEWLMQNGVPFLNAMAIVHFADKTDRSIPSCYVELRDINTLKNEE